MDDFFTNGIKIFLESSLTKFENEPNMIFDQNFENKFLNQVFINNINLFKKLLIQNSLKFKSYLSCINNYLTPKITSIQKIFENEFEIKQKEFEENPATEGGLKNIIDLGELNLLKFKIMKLSFDLIILNIKKSESFINDKEIEKNISVNKEKFSQLLKSLIIKDNKKENDFILFNQNYLVKLTQVIFENTNSVNLEYLKLLNVIYAEIKKNSTIESEKYIKEILNNPIKFYKTTSNNFKNNIKKLSRSRSASFDITTNEKKNKKINDYFKNDRKKENKENKENENTNNNLPTNNINEEINCFGSLGSQVSSIQKMESSTSKNFFSGISQSSLLSLDNNFLKYGKFNTPISELVENEKNNKNIFNNLKFKQIPKISIPQKSHKKGIRALEKIEKKIVETQFHKNNMSIINFLIKKKNEIKLKETLRNIVNDSFYKSSNEKEEDKSYEEKKSDKSEESDDEDEILESKSCIDENSQILIEKTPDKNLQKIKDSQQENNEEKLNEQQIHEIQENMLELYRQKTGQLS